MKVNMTLSYSYTMVCPPVRGDNPGAKLVDYLPYREQTIVLLFYHPHQYRPCSV